MAHSLDNMMVHPACPGKHIHDMEGFVEMVDVENFAHTGEGSLPMEVLELSHLLIAHWTLMANHYLPIVKIKYQLSIILVLNIACFSKIWLFAWLLYILIYYVFLVYTKGFIPNPPTKT